MDSIFLETCKKLELDHNVCQTWIENIKDKMEKEESRCYHNWKNFMMSKEKYLEKVESNCVIIAIFFQYYKFDVRKNCVEENCQAFEDFAKEANLVNDIVLKKTRKLIGDVSIEDQAGFSEDFDMLQDLNLTILGESPEKYIEYTKLLRKEYSHLEDQTYNEMRLKILETFLVIPKIYTNDLFTNLEKPARSNIKMEINELKK